MRKGNISQINNCNIHVDSEKYEILLLAKSFEDRWSYGFLKKKRIRKEKKLCQSKQKKFFKSLFCVKKQVGCRFAFRSIEALLRVKTLKNPITFLKFASMYLFWNSFIWVFLFHMVYLHVLNHFYALILLIFHTQQAFLDMYHVQKKAQCENCRNLLSPFFLSQKVTWNQHI